MERPSPEDVARAVMFPSEGGDEIIKAAARGLEEMDNVEKLVYQININHAASLMREEDEGSG